MKSLLLAISLGMAASTAAFAQDQAPPPADRAAFMQACGQDMQTYCASAQNRDDRRACMKANHDKFSDSCKTFMANRQMHQHNQMQSPSGQQ